MVRLEGGTHFLVLTEDLDSQQLFVNSYKSFKELMRLAQAGFRVSPIFPINKAYPPLFLDTPNSKLFFFGPIFPGYLDFETDISLYLTLGTFNVLAWCNDENQYNELAKFLDEHSIPFEIWQLEENRLIEPVEYNTPEIDIPSHFRDVIRVPENLKISAREYALLMHKAVGEASRYCKEQTKDLALFDKGFKEVQKNENDDLGRLTNFVVTNAALSRYISQAYAGCSPVLQTECSYTTNSLLGIGLANQVLISIQRFAANVFYKCRILQRIKFLEFVNSNGKRLYEVSSSDFFFEEDHLYNDVIEERINNLPADPIIPNITCFSGRDGFRATKFSLSAPLEVISGAHTFEWTLMTLTHEISHIVIEGFLGVFFKEPRDKNKSEHRVKLLCNFTPVSKYEQAEQLLIFGFMLLYQENRSNLNNFSKSSEESSEDIPMNVKEVSKYIVEGSPEANETLTHIFDFLYFYRAKESLYINSVWSSWAVVPNIETRIPQYITRTLCAIHSASLNWEIDDSIDSLERHLKKLASNRKTKPGILEEAYNELKRKRSKYKNYLENRLPFIKFVRAFLYSPIISDSLVSETIPAAPFPGFRRDKISNPLSFLEEHAMESKPNMLKSVWMLQHLAFCENHE